MSSKPDSDNELKTCAWSPAGSPVDSDKTEAIPLGPKTAKPAFDAGQTTNYSHADQDSTEDAPTPDDSQFFDPSATASLSDSSVVTENDSEYLVSEAGIAAQKAAPPGYDILRVLGRGGMGVVYEARQRSLKRLVALKMVTAGAHANPEHLARFQVEAEAVAALQHPNIVQIHEVGEHNGVPFFSLEFVDGGTLSEKIEDRPLSPRKAAELVKQLAGAMHFAHQHGIVHRDLKPGNVLMTTTGVPKVTDFGLAKRIDGEAQSSQTEAGSILGTPSYMAPEQAKGAITEIGPLADVYSLGAVLYHLVTGRPPFVGSTLLETLEQVRSQEPVAVRQLLPKAPRDLETICLKCLQKEPKKRYADAEALSRDIGHFLTGEPIEARAVGPFGRFWRWCRRHPGVASLTATVFTLLAVVAVTSSVLLVRIAAEKAKTEIARQEAVKAKELAEKNEELATEQRLLAVKAKGLAEKNAELATEQGLLAVKALYNVVVKVQQQLRGLPGSQKLREELIGDSFGQLARVVNSAADVPLFRRVKAAAFQHMGDIAMDLGRTEDALESFKKCQALIEAMAADEPTNPVTQYNLSVVYEKLGDVNHQLLGDGAIARGYYLKSLDICQGLVGETLRDPDDKPVNMKVRLSSSLLRLSNLTLGLGDPKAAWVHFQKFMEIRYGKSFATPKVALEAPTGGASDQQLTVDFALRMNDLSFHLGDFESTRGWLNKALDMSQAAVKRNPTANRAQKEQARANAAMGDFELKMGAPDKAKVLYIESHSYYEKLAQQQQSATSPRLDLSLSHYRLGTAYSRLGQAAEADQHFNECLKLRQALTKEDPRNTYNQINWMLIAARCGQHAEAAAQADRLWKQAPKDPAMLVYVAATYGFCSAKSLSDLALKERYEKTALDALNQAIDAGFRDVVALKTDPDLDPLRGHELFQKLVTRLEKSPS